MIFIVNKEFPHTLEVQFCAFIGKRIPFLVLSYLLVSVFSITSIRMCMVHMETTCASVSVATARCCFYGECPLYKFGLH